MKIDIPLSCPSCGGKMYSVSYESTLSLLKKRSWQVCKECDFERESDEFKKTICCAQAHLLFFQSFFNPGYYQKLELKVFHKSTCITCKKTITELDRMKQDVETRDFFKDPFSVGELAKIIKLTGKKPVELLRKRDKMYKELDLENTKKTDQEIIKLMIEYPGLIMRPIIIKDKKAFVGKVDMKNIQSEDSFLKIRTASR